MSGPKPDAAREAALELLRRVYIEDAYANLVMPNILNEAGLGARDSAFATELGYGTLRMQGRHDRLIEACVSRPLDELDPALHAVLRLGVHQITAMRVPPHAAVSTSVDMARAEAGVGAARLANAVLRRVASRPLDEWIDELSIGMTPVQRLAFVYSHPEWAVRALTEALAASRPGDDVEDLLAANNTPAPVTLVARSMPRSELLDMVPGSMTSPLSPLAVVMTGGDPSDVKAVRDGRAGVQDAGSQAVALALVAESISGSDLHWLDLCAGPGGKAAILAAKVARRGGELTAAELHPHRAELVRKTLAGVSGEHRIVVGDALELVGGPFDRVLVDAPCTGLGALRRRPESRWRERDLDALTRLQRDLVAKAVSLTRPGGVVMYATCSPHRAETRDITEWAAQALPVRRGHVLQTWPHADDADAMFAQSLHRI